jgi:lantibiotic modifying enzyme
MCFPEEDWLDTCSLYMKDLVNHISENGLSNTSLFSGTTGIALAVKASSCNGKYFNKLFQTIHGELLSHLEGQLEDIYKKTHVEMFDYDVIEGLAGVANYLLLDETTWSDKHIQSIISYFISLTEDYEFDNKKLPKWHIHAQYLFSEEEKTQYPDGIFNLGLSHGITGPLIILCKAYEKGIQLPGQLDAIARLSQQIVRLKLEESNRWGGMLSLSEYLLPQQQSTHTRDAWCYGTPGVAYALLTAADILNDHALHQTAIQAMEELIGNESGIFSPTFCHGYSGLAYIFKRFYDKTNKLIFLDESHRLRDKIVSYYSEDNPFGFCNIEHENGEECRLNSVGLLDGVTGVMLTILGLEIGNENSIWNSAFLLND